MSERAEPKRVVRDYPLLKVYQFVEILEREKESLAEQHGILSMKNLQEKLKDLKKAKYRGVDRNRLLELSTVVMWYQDYCLVNGVPPNLEKDLTSEAILDFKVNGMIVPFPQGESLSNVLTVLRRNVKDLRLPLFSRGIKTLDDVIRNRKELKDGIFGTRQDGKDSSSTKHLIPEEIQKELSQVADWYDDFVKKHNREPDMQEDRGDFTELSFNDFRKVNHYRYNLNVKEYFSLTKIAVKEKKTPDFLEAFDEDQRPVVKEQIILYGVKEVKDNFMSLTLREKAPLDLDRLLIYWVSKVINFESENTYAVPLVRAGSTQSGKSADKAVFLAVCRCFGIFSVVITKGDRESMELRSKLEYFADPVDKELVLGKKSLRKTKKLIIRPVLQNALNQGGAIVIADTKAQCEKLNAVIQICFQKNVNFKFAAFIDEADAMFRTFDRSQKFESEYEELVNNKNVSMRPCLRNFITATPVPVFLALGEEEDQLADGSLEPRAKDIKMMRITPVDDYIGVGDMRPVQNESGYIYLTQGELKHSQGIQNGKDGSHIPYTNEKTEEMYRDASLSPTSLLLDITNNRVNTENNVKVKASRVQQHMKKEYERDIAIVINIGEGLSYRLPGQSWVRLDKKVKVGQVLDSIREGTDLNNDESDEDFVPETDDGSESSKRIVSSRDETTGINNDEPDKDFVSEVDGGSESPNQIVSSGDAATIKGFSGPIFVFGFSLMKRSISYRGTYDVPTHIILQMGGGHNIENVVQALGRATFIGRKQLNDNGFGHVKVLMTENDFNMTRSYQNFVKEVDKRACRGKNIFEAINGTLEALPDAANFLQWTLRRTGMRSKSKPGSFDQLYNPRFEEPKSLSDIDCDVANFFADDSKQECYRTAKICRELWQKQENEFETDDIADAFNDHYSSRGDVDSIYKASVKKHMNAIKKYGIIMEMPMPSSANKRYSLARHFGRMVNILSRAHELRKERKTNRKRSAESDDSKEL